MADERNRSKFHAICNTVKVKETGAGGRLYSGVLDEDLDNGTLLFLGDLLTMSRFGGEIRQLKKPTTTSIQNEVPVLVMNPEILYDESTKSKQALRYFYNEANKAVPCIPISDLDEIELTKEAFSNAGDLAVGKYVIMEDGALKLKVDASAPVDAKVYGKITSSRKSHLSVYLGGTGSLFPTAYELYNIEFRVK